MNKYTKSVQDFIESYAVNQAISFSHGLAEVLADIRLICEQRNIDFEHALELGALDNQDDYSDWLEKQAIVSRNVLP